VPKGFDASGQLLCVNAVGNAVLPQATPTCAMFDLARVNAVIAAAGVTVTDTRCVVDADGVDVVLYTTYVQRVITRVRMTFPWRPLHPPH
jgi:hypothetical protein